MANPPARLSQVGNPGDFLARIKGIGSRIIYVGIPADSSRSRSKIIKQRASRFTSKRKDRVKEALRLRRISKANQIGNAYALYMFSKGSILHKIPPRPVLEPAILAPGNRERISKFVALSAAAYSQGKVYVSKQMLKRAGVAAKNACYDWFEDPRNKWAPNASETERRKGFNAPGIDTRAMRNAITYVERDV